VLRVPPAAVCDHMQDNSALSCHAPGAEDFASGSDSEIHELMSDDSGGVATGARAQPTRTSSRRPAPSRSKRTAMSESDSDDWDNGGAVDQPVRFCVTKSIKKVKKDLKKKKCPPAARFQTVDVPGLPAKRIPLEQSKVLTKCR
jgi:hypothetical protein